jgi:hypothetical protein
VNQTEAELVIEWFLDLETRLKQFLRAVPINWNHNAVLPLLAGVIVEAAGLVDSILRKQFDLSGCKTQRKNLRITHFQDYYEQQYSFSSKNTLIYQHPPVLLNPFREWVFPSGRPESTLEWWDAYNKLKHERIEHYQRCTLSNAVLSLCALHQVLSVLPCFFKALVAHDMIELREYAIRYAIESIEQGRENMPFLSESELFATPYGKQGFPSDLLETDKMLEWSGKRLQRFLGR